MRTCFLDLETFWSQEHTLSKMSPMAYCTHPETEVISIAVKFDNGNTDVLFGEDLIKKTLAKLDWSDTMVIGHNLSGFDSMILAWRFGMKPKMWGCTLAMARPVHAITVGNSLAKLVAHYELGRKDNAALINTKGRHLRDFTQDEIDAMRTYNRDDVEQCYGLFKKLRPHYTARELWHIDASVRMLVDPAFVVDRPLVETALSVERDHKKRAILTVGRELRKMADEASAITEATTIEELEEAVRVDLASAPKFAALLEMLNVEVPTKVSPTNPEKRIPALAKTDEGFIALQDHENEVVAAAARARLAVKSTLLETRIGAFLEASAAVKGRLPVPLNYCGATTTGRWSGWAYNPQNLPRITPGKPRTADALRNCLKAPKGYMVVVADLSGIELRVNHFLWKVPESMALYQSDSEADLYKAFASARYGVAVSEVTKDQRQMGKVAHLGLGFGAGWKTFQRFAKTVYGLVIEDDEAQAVVEVWRVQYAEIVRGWKVCGGSLNSIRTSEERPVDDWGLVVTHPEGLRLPSGRLIRYPNLRQEEDGRWDDGRMKKTFMYGDGRHKTRLTGPKVDENIVQALARDIIADNCFDVFKLTGLRPALLVHDELVYVVPESEAQATLDVVQGVMRMPPKWWPDIVVWSEGDIAGSYGSAK